MADKPIYDAGYIKTESGLLLPPAYANDDYTSIVQGDSRVGKSVWLDGGVMLDRDPESLIVTWTRPGSNRSERILEAIARGQVANGSISGFPYGKITGLLQRQIAQASNSSIVLSGRTSPVKNASAGIAMMNDSAYGYTECVKQIMESYRTYTKGAIIATVPLTYSYDTWSEYGLTAIPIGRESQAQYYLEVDWAQVKYPVPFLLSVYDCYPTGNQEWPYWYRFNRDGKRSYGWILLHNTQVLSMVSRPASSVYACTSFLGGYILAEDERVERLIVTPSEGILAISGVSQAPKAIRDSIREQAQARRDEGVRLDKGWTLFTTNSGEIKIAAHRFREPDGLDPEVRSRMIDNELALYFQESSSSLYTQSDGFSAGKEAQLADNNSDAGVGSFLHELDNLLGAIYPRVRVTSVRASAILQRSKMDMLATFAGAAKNLFDAGAGLTADQIQTIINRDILEIPSEGVGEVVEDVSADENADEAENDEAALSLSLRLEFLAHAYDRGGLTAMTQMFYWLAVLFDGDDVKITDVDVDRSVNDSIPDMHDFLVAE